MRPCEVDKNHLEDVVLELREARKDICRLERENHIFESMMKLGLRPQGGGHDRCMREDPIALLLNSVKEVTNGH